MAKLYCGSFAPFPPLIAERFPHSYGPTPEQRHEFCFALVWDLNWSRTEIFASHGQRISALRCRWSESLLLIHGGASTVHQDRLRVRTKNKAKQQVRLNDWFFNNTTLWCVAKSCMFVFRPAGWKWSMQLFHSVKHPTLISAPGWRPQWENYNLPIRLQH